MVNAIRLWFRVTDRPTEVKLGIYVISFYSISEQTMVWYIVCVHYWPWSTYSHL